MGRINCSCLLSTHNYWMMLFILLLCVLQASHGSPTREEQSGTETIPRLEGCQSDNDCRDREMCFNGDCVHPCLLQHPCAKFAECYPASHKAMCRCIPGYEGNPFKACEAIGCRQDAECPKSEVCRSKDCINPCLYYVSL